LPNKYIINMSFRFFYNFSICLIFISSCKGKTEKDNISGKENTVNFIEGIIVKPSVLEQTIMVSGTLIPFEETVLMPDVTGRIISINFQEGMFVKKGTLLMQLFNDDIQAQLHKLQTELEIAEQTEKRQSELAAVNGISQQEYDQTMLQVHSVKDDIEVVQAQLSKTKIVAPFDGIIGLRNFSVGAVVTPGSALVTIRQVNQLKLEFSFPGKYGGYVKKDTKVKFTLQGKEEEFEAVVTATEGGIDIGTRNLKAVALVSSVNSELIPGMYANVELHLKESNHVLMVPTQAIIPQERNKKLIVAKGGKASFIIVKTGVRQASDVEILSGVEAGDTVVTTGVLFIKPNSSLEFSKVIN
jgi:membrane fusion protein, multidrug efflux system